MTISSPSVLHLIPNLQVGGAEKTLVELLSDTEARENAQVVVLSGGGPFEKHLAEQGVSVVDLGARGLFSLVPAAWRLACLIRSERPQIIQTWLYYADFLGLIALWLSGRRRKTILSWGIRCSDHRLQEYGFALRMVIRLCARLSGAPDIVVYNSNAGRQSHSARGYRPRREAVIENGIDTAPFDHVDADRARVRAEFGWRNDDVVMALIGRTDRQKGYDLYLELANRFPDVKALAVGSGTKKLPKVSNILALGVRSDVPSLLAAADILVSCPHYGEGFPNVVAEGMAAGCAVVASDVGDTARVLGDAGIVFPAGDSAALTGAVRELISDAGRRRSLGQRGRERINAEFPLSRMAAAFTGLYRDLVR